MNSCHSGTTCMAIRLTNLVCMSCVHISRSRDKMHRLVECGGYTKFECDSHCACIKPHEWVWHKSELHRPSPYILWSNKSWIWKNGYCLVDIDIVLNNGTKHEQCLPLLRINKHIQSFTGTFTFIWPLGTLQMARVFNGIVCSQRWLSRRLNGI